MNIDGKFIKTFDLRENLNKLEVLFERGRIFGTWTQGKSSKAYRVPRPFLTKTLVGKIDRDCCID